MSDVLIDRPELSNLGPALTKALAKAKPGCTCLLAAGDRVIDLVSRAEPIERPAADAVSHAPAHA